MSTKFKNNIEQELWKTIYLQQLDKVEQSKEPATIKSFSIMASQFADDAVYEFRARAGNHTQILPVVDGTNDDKFQDNHRNFLVNKIDHNHVHTFKTLELAESVLKIGDFGYIGTVGRSKVLMQKGVEGLMVFVDDN